MAMKEYVPEARSGRVEIAAFSGAVSTPASALASPHPICLSSDMGIESAATLLLERVLPAAPVADDGRLLGIVCLEDLLPDRIEGDESAPLPRAHTRRGIAYDPGAGFHPVQLATSNVEERMRRCQPAVIDATSIAEAAALMVSQCLPLLPVVDGDRRVTGMVTSAAILEWLAREHGLPVAAPAPPLSH